MSQDLYSSPSPSQSSSTKDFTFQNDNEEALLTLQVSSADYFVLLAFSFRLTTPRFAGVSVADHRTSCECPASLLQLDTGLWQCQAVLNTPRTSSTAFPPVVP